MFQKMIESVEKYHKLKEWIKVESNFIGFLSQNHKKFRRPLTFSGICTNFESREMRERKTAISLLRTGNTKTLYESLK